MDLIHNSLSFFLHLDDHLDYICQHYGIWTYAILFLIVFCETGLVVTPFLPGDSLLFTVGAFAARGSLDIWFSIFLLFVAAVLGDFVNYWAGAKIGGGLFTEDAVILKKAHLDRTHAFYEKHGGKTIILARFLPIIRTVAPFVAGMGQMTYFRFASYNVIGAAAWVLSMTGLGWFFGNIPFVKDHFELVVIGIVFVSILPVVFEAIGHWLSARRAGSKAPAKVSESVK